MGSGSSVTVPLRNAQRVGHLSAVAFMDPNRGAAWLGSVPLSFEYRDSITVGYQASCLFVLLHRPPHNIIDRQRPTSFRSCRWLPLLFPFGGTSALHITHRSRLTRFGAQPSRRRTRYKRLTAYHTEATFFFRLPLLLPIQSVLQALIRTVQLLTFSVKRFSAMFALTFYGDRLLCFMFPITIIPHSFYTKNRPPSRGFIWGLTLS